MTSKQIKLLKKICSNTNTKDCIVACKWIHPEVDGGFPVVFLQLANGEGVIDCISIMSIHYAFHWTSHTIVSGTCRLLLADDTVDEIQFTLFMFGRI